jgi:membrane protein
MFRTKISIRLRQLKSSLLKKTAVQLMLGTAKRLGYDNATDMAGSIAYYGILSIFPLLLGVISILGLFLPSETVQKQIFQYLEENMPASVDLVKHNISAIISVRGTLGVVSLLGLFWSGSAIFGTIGRVMNVAWGIRVRRPFYIRKLRDIVLALTTSILFFLSLGLTSFSAFIPMIDIGTMGTLTAVVSRLLGFLTIYTLFLIMYKIMPATKTRWRCIWPGALLAAILFELVKSLFIFYLENFSSYELVYGSLASVIILLVWVYVSAYILIIGAEVSSGYSHMCNRDD